MSWRNPYGDWQIRMRNKVGETRDGRKLYEIELGTMVIYDHSAQAPYDKPWTMHPFDGCFGDRQGSMCSWVPPGCWPEWML